MNDVDNHLDEQEVLNGVSMLQQELELERSLNDGLVKQFEEMKIQHDSDSEITTELRKRIIKLENDLVDGLSKSNEKRNGEEALLTRLRTLLEKSEAARHQSEYTLLLEQKNCRELKEELADKSTACSDEISKYKDLLTECQLRAKEWEKAVQLSQKAADMEKENMDKNLENLGSLLKEKDSVIEFMNFESSEKRTQFEEISVAFETARREHEKTKTNLKTCEQMIKEQKDITKQQCLKQAVFDQKEKKFKQDIQDMVEDRNRIENQLQRERGLNIQSTQQFAVVQDQLIILEQDNCESKKSLENEKTLKSVLQNDLEACQAQFTELRNAKDLLEQKLESTRQSRAATEGELKKALCSEQEHVTHLLAQLQQHQAICRELAGEMATLHASMDQIEQQYSSSMTGLEKLYCQYFSSAVPPTGMVAVIAAKLHSLNTNSLMQETEVETLKRDVERQASLSQVQTKSLDSKSETIKSLQEQLCELSAQQGTLESDHGTLSSTNRALQQQVQDMTALLATEQEKTLTLLKDKKDAIKQRHDFLKEQCATMQHVGEVLGVKVCETDWPEVARATLQAAQTAAAEKKELNILLREAQDDIGACHVSMETLSKQADNTRVECSRKLSESETLHSQHSKALEGNYRQLVDALNAKIKVSDGNIHNTNGKIKSFFQENEMLKEQVSALEEDLLTCEKRRVNFQAAVGMLGSTVLHHMNSYNRVLYVLSLYKIQIKRNEEKEKELKSLSEALTEKRQTTHPIYRFRKAVIIVLAVNRFKVFGSTYKHNYVLGVPHDTNPIDWLESDTLDRLFTTAIRHWRTRPLSNTTDKLVSCLYNNTNTLDTEMYSGSLLHKIAAGLKRNSQPYTLPNPILNVRTFVLNLTQRLHSVEVERRSLIVKVNHWQKEASELKGAVQQTDILSKKVHELEGMAFKTVSIGKHESVMKELATVMSREDCLREETHNLRQQLKRLEESYEHTSCLLNERSGTLDEAIKDLANQKILVRQSEQSQRVHARKVTTLESEKKNLYEQLHAVQKCVESGTRDRDSLLSYVSKLQVALQERKMRVTSGNLTTATGYLSSDESSLQVEEVQKICSLYEDILKLAQRRIAGLDRDLASFKTHTDSLKGELSAACQRLVLDDIPTGRPLVGQEPDREEVLLPLVQRSGELGAGEQRPDMEQVRELGARVGHNFQGVIGNVMWS